MKEKQNFQITDLRCRMSSTRTMMTRIRGLVEEAGQSTTKFSAQMTDLSNSVTNQAGMVFENAQELVNMNAGVLSELADFFPADEASKPPAHDG